MDAVLRPAVDAVLRPAVEGVLRPAVDAVLRPAVDAVLRPGVDAVLRPAVDAGLRPAVDAVHSLRGGGQKLRGLMINSSDSGRSLGTLLLFAPCPTDPKHTTTVAVRLRRQLIQTYWTKSPRVKKQRFVYQRQTSDPAPNTSVQIPTQASRSRHKRPDPNTSVQIPTKPQLGGRQQGSVFGSGAESKTHSRRQTIHFTEQTAAAARGGEYAGERPEQDPRRST
ncbi:uncharacterized protein V6R79_006149 [Siganus canaliculatus]